MLVGPEDNSDNKTITDSASTNIPVATDHSSDTDSSISSTPAPNSDSHQEVTPSNSSDQSGLSQTDSAQTMKDSEGISSETVSSPGPSFSELKPSEDSRPPESSYGSGSFSIPAGSIPPTQPPPKGPPKVVTGGRRLNRFVKPVKFLLLLIVIAGLCGGAYMLGKGHQKVKIEAPAPLPVNLPAQAVARTACVPGRGKQYAIPADLPAGPIYDVENSKVIAIEYNLNLSQVFSNSDTFSNAILSVTKNYPVDHFSVAQPATTGSSTAQTSQTQSASSNIDLVMFMVSKAESAKITCGTAKTTTSSATSATGTKP